MIASPKTPGGVKSSLFLSEQNHLFPIATSELNHLFFTFIGTKVILFTCWVDLPELSPCPPGHFPPCCLVSILDRDPAGIFFVCFATRPSHCPTVAFYQQDRGTFRRGQFFATQGLCRAWIFVQSFPVFHQKRNVQIETHKLLSGDAFPLQTICIVPVPPHVPVDHPHQCHALDLTAVAHSQLRCLMSPCIFSRTVLHSYLFCLSVVQKAIVGWPA